jgi:hypothetical protein
MYNTSLKVSCNTERARVTYNAGGRSSVEQRTPQPINYGSPDHPAGNFVNNGCGYVKCAISGVSVVEQGCQKVDNISLHLLMALM